MGKVVRDGSVRSMAFALGLSEHYFYVMKCSCPDKYKYVTGLANNMYDAYSLYQDEMAEVKKESTLNYYWLNDRAKMSMFSRFLKEEGLYTNGMSFASTVSGILFNSIVGFSTHPTFLKQKKILPLFDKFMKINKDEKWAK